MATRTKTTARRRRGATHEPLRRTARPPRLRAGRNGKLRLMTDYFRTTPDPDRGWALAALTGALSFQHAKPACIRALIAERIDPVLFGLSYDYVGDLAETVALIWPADPARQRERAADARPRSSTTLATLGKARAAGAARALARRARRDRPLGAAQAGHRRLAHRRLGAARQDRGRGARRQGRRTRSRSSGTAWRRPTSSCSPGSKAAPTSRSAAIRRRSAR